MEITDETIDVLLGALADQLRTLGPSWSTSPAGSTRP
jgi:hypothetical protein